MITLIFYEYAVMVIELQTTNSDLKILQVGHNDIVFQFILLVIGLILDSLLTFGDCRCWLGFQFLLKLLLLSILIKKIR